MNNQMDEVRKMQEKLNEKHRQKEQNTQDLFAHLNRIEMKLDLILEKLNENNLEDEMMKPLRFQDFETNGALKVEEAPTIKPSDYIGDSSSI